MPPDDLLTHYLADHDAQCPVCGYALRGLHDPRCPECGVTLHLGVVPASTRLGWWIVSLIAWAAGTGFGLLVSGWLVVLAVLANNDPGPRAWSFGVSAGLCGIALFLIVVLRKRLQRLPTGLRVTIAIGSVVLALALCVGVLVLNTSF